MSTRNAMLALAAGTLIGIVVTLIARSEPGFLLGLFITVGAVVATLGVRRGAVYLFFPLPAFAFFVAAVITGKVHDSSISSSTTGLLATFLQWIADIFFPMCAATILVVLIGGARWLLSRQVVGGQFPMSADRPANPGSPRPRAAPNGSGQRPGSAPWLGPDGARSARPARDPRDDRDPWNDPRPAADRRPPTRSDPPAAPPPSFRPRPANPAQPGDRRPRPPAPQRPPRDTWDQR
jgi:hypothetical protein